MTVVILTLMFLVKNIHIKYYLVIRFYNNIDNSVSTINKDVMRKWDDLKVVVNAIWQ